MAQSTRRLLLVLSVCLAWAMISVAPVWKYISHAKAGAATALGLLAIAFGMYRLDRLNRRQRQIGTGWFVLLFLALTAAFAVLYPISLKHTLNSGSDREDALRLELMAIHHHQYPYDARTFQGNPPTPLPGALLLSVPFFALGHIAWQNFLWYALFFIFTMHFFRYRATALFFLTVFLLLAPANLSDFTSGGDYLTNFFYVAIASALFTRSLSCSLRDSIFAALFLGITLSSRSIYLTVLIPLFVLTVQRTTRFRATVLFGTVLATAAVVTLPIFMPYPIAHLLRQLSQNSDKLRYIPGALHAQGTLPLLAAIVACLTVNARMDLPRMFLSFSAASFATIAPPVAMLAIHRGKPSYELSYLSVSVLSYSLWALTRWERLSPTAPQNVDGEL